MIYIHYCANCNFLHLLSGHRINCPRCNGNLAELKISYQEYFQLDKQGRENLLKRCANPEELAPMVFYYKKHKFSKWYKEGGVRG